MNLPVITYSVGDAFRAPSSFPSSPCPSPYPVGQKEKHLVKTSLNRKKNKKSLSVSKATLRSLATDGGR